jgi:hypothetical protein
MTNPPLLAAMALALLGPALAAGDQHQPQAQAQAQAQTHAHAHAHAHAPLHGGVVVEVKDIDYELVARPATIRLHLRDHGKPADVSQASARLTLLTGSDKQEVALKPAGASLEASGTFRLGPGTKAVAVVTIAGKPAATVRFVLP